MSIDPISHNQHSLGPTWGAKTKQVNVGTFESDPGLREAILALPADEMGGSLTILSPPSRQSIISMHIF